MHANAGARRFEPVDAARRGPDRGQRASTAILELNRRIRRAIATRSFAQPTLTARHDSAADQRGTPMVNNTATKQKSDASMYLAHAGRESKVPS